MMTLMLGLLRLLPNGIASVLSSPTASPVRVIGFSCGWNRRTSNRQWIYEFRQGWGKRLRTLAFFAWHPWRLRITTKRRRTCLRPIFRQSRPRNLSESRYEDQGKPLECCRELAGLLATPKGCQCLGQVFSDSVCQVCSLLMRLVRWRSRIEIKWTLGSSFSSHISGGRQVNRA